MRRAPPHRTRKGIAAMTEPIRFGTVGTPKDTPKPGGTALAIQHMREALGFDHLEIAWVRSVRISDDACAEIKAAAERHNFSLSVHASYYINLNSQTPEKMKASDERLLLAARKGYLAGATDIIFHPGSYHKQPPEKVYDRIKEKLIEIRDILDVGGTDVTLRPETTGKVATFGTLDELLQLSQEVPGVLPCIDVAHLHARSNGEDYNTYDDFARIFKATEQALGREALERMHFHISGIAYNPRGEQRHLPVEESDMNYRDFFRAAVDFGARGVVVGEAPDAHHVTDAQLFQRTYRQYLNGHKPE
jgi:deoxyribonuclease-4